MLLKLRRTHYYVDISKSFTNNQLSESKLVESGNASEDYLKAGGLSSETQK